MQQRQTHELDPARDLDPRRTAESAHAVDATARVVAVRPPAWGWTLAEEGSLALDRDDLWDETRRGNGLQPHTRFATVPPMSLAPATGRVLRARQVERERRRRRLALLVVIAIVALATLLVTAFGGGDHPSNPATAPASASRLLPAGPPEPEVVARLGSLHLQLPVNRSRVTAIGYHGGSAGALSLDPVGSQANQGLLRRLLHKAIGGNGGTLRWYQLSGGTGPATSGLDVGAAPTTDVYSPVDGLIVALDNVVLHGRPYGTRIDIQPSALRRSSFPSRTSGRIRRSSSARP